MVRCAECGNSFYIKEGNICSDCEVIFEKRSEIREAINILSKYAKMQKHSLEFRGISGYSQAEKERFAIVLLQFAKNIDLPDKESYFVNDERKEQFKSLRGETIDSSNKMSLDKIKKMLIEKGDWKDASYNELICHCTNSAFRALKKEKV